MLPIDPMQVPIADPIQSLVTAEINAVTEALKFQYGLVTLLMAGIGYRFAKAWPTVAGEPAVKPSRPAILAAISAGGALLVMLYEQHVLVRSISRHSIMEFTGQWLSSGELLVDLFIALAAGCFALGWRR